MWEAGEAFLLCRPFMASMIPVFEIYRAWISSRIFLCDGMVMLVGTMNDITNLGMGLVMMAVAGMTGGC